MNTYSRHERKLYRSDDAIFFGVCGGLAEYADLSPAGVRLMWVLLSIPFFPFMPLAYLIMGIVLKKRPREPFPPPPPGPGGEASPFRDDRPLSHSEMLRQIQQRSRALDLRLQRLESIVTSPGFGLENQWHG